MALSASSSTVSKHSQQEHERDIFGLSFLFLSLPFPSPKRYWEAFCHSLTSVMNSSTRNKHELFIKVWWNLMKAWDVNACLCTHHNGEDPLAFLESDRFSANGDYRASLWPKDVLLLCAHTIAGQAVVSSMGASLPVGSGEAAVWSPCTPYDILSQF